MKNSSKIVLPALTVAFVVALLVTWYAGRRQNTRSTLSYVRPGTSAGQALPGRPHSPSSLLASSTPSSSGNGPASSAVASARGDSGSASVSVNDPTRRSLQPELAFSNRVRSFRALEKAAQIAKGRELLSSASAEDRALGGVLLFFNSALNDRLIRFIADDAQLAVPLTVFDWIRDFGAEEEITTFRSAIDTREISTEDLLAYIVGSSSQPGGGRSALDLLIPRFDEEEIEEGLLPVVSATGASYDAREQALFKLFEPESKSSGLAALEAIAAELPDGDASLFAEAVGKWTQLIHLSDPDDEDVPYKVWDTPLRDLTYMADSNVGLAVRDMANYLEYGLRRDDPDFEPVIEEGSWEVAKTFFDRVQTYRDSLLPEEEAALDRIAANLGRLKAFDPAFAPGADEDNPLDDEVISDEILNAEDFYVAEYLTSDDEGEDPEEEENPPGVSKEELDDDEDDSDDEDSDDDDGDSDSDDEDAEDNEDSAEDDEDADDDEDWAEDADDEKSDTKETA